MDRLVVDADIFAPMVPLFDSTRGLYNTWFNTLYAPVPGFIPRRSGAEHLSLSPSRAMIVVAARGVRRRGPLVVAAQDGQGG